MKRVKQAKLAYIILSAVLIAAGLAIVIFPDISAVTICCAAGVVMLVFGAIRIIGYFVNDAYGLAFQFDFAMGIFTAIIGTLLLLHPQKVVTLLPMLLGVFTLIDSVFKLQTSVDARKFGLSRWWSILIISIVNALFGILLIFEPSGAASVIMRLLGISVILDGVQNLYIAAYAVKLVKGKFGGVYEATCSDGDTNAGSDAGDK
ncbi:MAG: DUF308 domain-containing protein [Eubacteriales bacterium]